MAANLSPIQSTSSRSSSPLSVASNSFSTDSLPEETDVVKAPPSPAFIVYSDSEICNAARNNQFSTELTNRLVRNTISNMRSANSACQHLPVSRLSTTLEMEDMARALCQRYPCLEKKRSDDGKSFVSLSSDEKSGLMPDEKNQLHVSHDG